MVINIMEIKKTGMGNKEYRVERESQRLEETRHEGILGTWVLGKGK